MYTDIPDISIITTVKNGELYLAEMLCSVNNQSFRNFEHIIVDDGSTDHTLDVLEKFLKDYPGYPLTVYAESSKGRGRSLNFAISKARSEWIAIIDADDLWHDEKLTTQLDVIRRMPLHDQPTVLATKSVSFYGTPPSLDSLYPKRVSVLSLQLRDFLVKNPICHSSVLIKKGLAIYDENRESQFDLDLWLRLISRKNRIWVLDEALTFHRKHRNQSFEAKLGNKMLVNSYRLKAKYSLKFACFYAFIKSTIDIVYILYFRKHMKRGKG